MIETERLLIRKMDMNDYEALKLILYDPVTMQFWPKPFSPEQVKNWINRNVENYKKYGFGRWIVELKNSREIIGDCGFLILEIDGKVENDLGYIIYSKYWGKGYGTEAAKACLEYGFKELGMKRIIANMPYNHYASIRVAEKLGMIKEKEFINKRNRDILTYLFFREA